MHMNEVNKHHQLNLHAETKAAAKTMCIIYVDSALAELRALKGGDSGLSFSIADRTLTSYSSCGTESRGSVMHLIAMETVGGSWPKDK